MYNQLFIFAAKLLGDPADIGIPTKAAGTSELSTFLNAVYFIAGFISIIVIVLAGLAYASSAGDSGKITKAKNAILYAVIGIVVIASAFVITNFITGGF